MQIFVKTRTCFRGRQRCVANAGADAWVWASWGVKALGFDRDAMMETTRGWRVRVARASA